MNLLLDNIVYILENLSIDDLINFGQTCVLGNELCKDDRLWKYILYDKYGIGHKLDVNLTWMDNAIKIRKIYELIYTIDNTYGDVINNLKRYNTLGTYTLDGMLYRFGGLVIVYNVPKNPNMAVANIMESNEYILIGLIHEGYIYSIYEDENTLQITKSDMYINKQQYKYLKTGQPIIIRHARYTKYIIYLSKLQIQKL